MSVPDPHEWVDGLLLLYGGGYSGQGWRQRPLLSTPGYFVENGLRFSLSSLVYQTLTINIYYIYVRDIILSVKFFLIGQKYLIFEVAFTWFSGST